MGASMTSRFVSPACKQHLSCLKFVARHRCHNVSRVAQVPFLGRSLAALAFDR